MASILRTTSRSAAKCPLGATGQPRRPPPRRHSPVASLRRHRPGGRRRAARRTAARWAPVCGCQMYAASRLCQGAARPAAVVRGGGWAVLLSGPICPNAWPIQPRGKLLRLRRRSRSISGIDVSFVDRRPYVGLVRAWRMRTLRCPSCWRCPCPAAHRRTSSHRESRRRSAHALAKLHAKLHLPPAAHGAHFGRPTLQPRLQPCVITIA